MHSRHRAGSRDPELEDLLQRRLRRVQRRRRLHGHAAAARETRRSTARTPAAPRIGEANVTARRLDISGCENGLDINQNITVEDSYIHDLYNSAEAHTDGIQFATGHYVNGQLASGVVNVTIRHNTIYGMGADGSFGTSAIIDHSFGGNTNILIDSNLLAGGAYTLYCEHRLHGRELPGGQQPLLDEVQVERRLLRTVERLR